MGSCARPGEEKQVEEPEQTGSDLPFTQDVLPAALHVSTSTVSRTGQSERREKLQVELPEEVNVEDVYDGAECRLRGR